MTPGERIQIRNKQAIFITTAIGKAGKAEMAQRFGYDLLPSSLDFIAQEASRREDLYADYFRLKVVDHHYPRGSTISNTVHVAANKAEGVDYSFDILKKNNPGNAMELEGREYQVMDNQMVIVDSMNNKIALKKPRPKGVNNDIDFKADIKTLIDTIKMASAKGSHIEYLSAFVSGIFGHPTKKEYKTVRTIIGKMRSNINLDDLDKAMRDSTYVTGGIDISELIKFIDHTEAHIRTRSYAEGGRRYLMNELGKDSLVFVEKLVDSGEKIDILPSDYTSNPHILAGIARGFV